MKFIKIIMRKGYRDREMSVCKRKGKRETEKE